MDRIENTEVLEEPSVREKGIGYTLGEDGFYYSDLKLSGGTNYEIGGYGRMRERYLREHWIALCRELLLNGTLNEYLYRTDEECCQMMERLTEQMKAKQGVTEQLKATDQIKWVGINNIWYCAEEVVLKELVYV